MKKIIFLVLLFFIALFLYFRIFAPKQKLSTINYQLEVPYSSPTVTWNDIAYGFEYFEIKDISQLTLIANFTQKKSSELLIKENKCQYAINGGYYDTNSKPLGLFISHALKTASITNSLINGYIAITNKSTIDFDLPENPTIALQTGPMLMVEGKKLKLAIKNDEYARRMIAGIPSQGTLVFMTIFVPETKVQGPQLTDLPNIIEQINTTLPNPLLSAINLDGGNASMFKDKDVYIPEVLPIGSLFCLQE